MWKTVIKMWTWVAAVLLGAAMTLGDVAAAHASATAMAGSGTAKSFYVDCSKGRSGDGTLRRPWNSLAEVNRHVLAAGSQVLFLRNTRCVGTLAPKGSGRAGAIDRIGAYGAGAKPIIDGGGAANAVYLYNQQYWQISDLDITNAANPGTNRRGIQIIGHDAGTLRHLVLADLDIHDVLGDDTKDANGSGGIVFQIDGTDTPTKFAGVVVRDNILQRVDREGITFTSTWRHSTPGWPTSATYYPSTRVQITGNQLSAIGGDGVVVVATTGALIDHNTVAGFHVASAGYNAGVWPYDSDNTVVEYNDVSGGQTHLDGMAFDIDENTDGAVFQYNYSHNNAGGFFLLCNADGFIRNAVVRYNISQDDSYRGVENCSGPIESAAVYNNTIYVRPGAGMAVIRENNTAGRNVTFTNNIVYNAGSSTDATFSLATATGYRLAHNDLYRTSGQPDTAAITADPLLAAPGTATSRTAADGYKLATGSPALHSGVRISDNGGQDYFGNRLSSRSPNMGAYAGPAVTDTTPLSSAGATG